MELANRTGEEILEGLCVPRRRLVFVDESETPGKPLPRLAANYRVMCGVSMVSEKYEAVGPLLRSTLQDLGVDEFHATDIVHPTSESPWRRIRSKRRKRTLSFLQDVLTENADTIFFCYVSGQQYYDQLKPKVLAANGPDLSHKDALYKAFFNGLIPHLQLAGVPTAILIDSTLPLGDEAIGLQRICGPHGLFYEGSVIHIDSRVEVGIQLADFVAYMLNRVHHINQRQIDGRVNAFDEIVMTGVKRMESKFRNLLVKPGRQ
jgi:hypothetical protein